MPSPPASDGPHRRGAMRGHLRTGPSPSDMATYALLRGRVEPVATFSTRRPKEREVMAPSEDIVRSQVGQLES